MPHHPNTSRRSGETTTNSHNITAETDRPSPFIVGIAGGTASGKSTISLKIEEALADRTVLLMHMDAYFLRVKPRMRAPITGEEWEDHNHPDSFDLDGLVADLDAHRQGLTHADLHTHQHGLTHTWPPRLPAADPETPHSSGPNVHAHPAAGFGRQHHRRHS